MTKYGYMPKYLRQIKKYIIYNWNRKYITNAWNFQELKVEFSNYKIETNIVILQFQWIGFCETS